MQGGEGRLNRAGNVAFKAFYLLAARDRPA